ncbi:AAA family ATPase [Vibrio parahaemolyticus]|uniref:AAA family ATPase n=3 Tax=Vibrio parahaemolyticus TaxID=670 RepID=UPI0004D94D5C|nr:MoxR family ATPase [Vibrio parahaemolyticus]EGU6977277.1 AAA domain-containing protein [Vibrio parahaemolyticus]EIO2936012.1 MoxR family ATPase [Vibrio parahaemolyticus]EKB1989199.1 MoxR family ATPase [Vibrio parahaemolyticus]EME0132910.1 MoxR family ATPase [Vibrio parahaemolyticus]MBE3795840.1 MoxR family ATPase [Vibrio parahaemolyticus]
MNHAQQAIKELIEQTEKSVIGQSHVVRALVIGLLTNGHILLEGLPGTAKTRSVKSLANLLNTSFGRIQFTPDLLPSDVTGTEVYQELDGKPQLLFQPGPIFNSIVLADEVNRAPAKVQAALLEAMAEGTITVGDKTHVLPDLFMVLATQNPVEQEGTYPLPEAQMDRFIMKVTVDYPEDDAERDIIRLVRSEELGAETSSEIITPKHIEPDVVIEARRQLPNIVVSDLVENYIVALVMATRKPERYADSNLAKWIEIGSSPRASIALDKCARAYAWMQGRDHVTPDDVRAMVPSVLGHRFSLTYDALADGVDHQRVVQELLDCVEIG